MSIVEVEHGTRRLSITLFSLITLALAKGLAVSDTEQQHSWICTFHVWQYSIGVIIGHKEKRETED
jgi:hypothetical protein